MRLTRLTLLALLLTACGRPEYAVVPCALLTAGCVLQVKGKSLQVRTGSAPAPLHSFDITLQSVDARTVEIQFQMQGMEMGPNRYRLARQADGSWQGRVTLPVCVSGRRDWLLIIDIDGQRVAVPFQTS